MSVDQVKKFLDGVTEYPDTTPIRIGETEVPLGSLRQLTASERAGLADRMKAVETKENELNTRQSQIVDLAQKAQAAYQAAEDARRTATQPPPNPGADPFNDPWLQPVKAALDARDKKIEELAGQLKSAFQTQQQIASIWAEDRWSREYDTLNFGKREKKPTVDELKKFAAENKINDRFGLPSVRGAWEKMSEADRMEELRKAAEEKGREEGRMEALASRVTAPGVSGPGQGPAAQLKKGYNPDADVLGDLYADALKDPELRQQIESMGAGVL